MLYMALHLFRGEHGVRTNQSPDATFVLRVYSRSPDLATIYEEIANSDNQHMGYREWKKAIRARRINIGDDHARRHILRAVDLKLCHKVYFIVLSVANM